MATYVRQSSFSDGDTITAALFNNEFNQLVNAFHVETGHTHDGATTGDGGPISNLFSNALVFGTNANTDVAITFNATTNDGVLTWMEDEDYFKFSDDLLIDSTEKVQFRDTGLYIYSSADGQLDIVADTEVQIAATTIDINGNADISGNLGIGGNLTVTGTTTFNGGTITMGDAATDNVVFGADVNSNIIPNTDSAFDLGSSTQEWRDLYLDGTAHIDTLDVDVNATIAGTLGVTGVLTGTSLDISGDIDVDGTTNLDVVDIDGAVDMATTLAVAGNVDFNGDLDVDGTTNLDVVDIDGAVDMASNLAVGGNITVTGDLTVNGSTTTLNTATLDVEDKNITLNKGAGDTSGSVDGAGITIQDAVDASNDASITWSASNDNFVFSHEVVAPSLDISGNVDIDGTLETDALSINSTAVTSTAAELNILDGVTSTATELNLLDGVTSTTAELNILDGVTASAADINLIDGITNGTVIASKAIVTDANIDITGGRNITISGELDAATLDISGNGDVAGTLAVSGGSSNGVLLSQGAISIKNGGAKSYIDLYCESSNAHYTRIEAAAHGAYSGNVTATLPVTTGTLAITSEIPTTEEIQDIVGAMVSSNTESGITVAYQDADGTIDFTVGTLNQNTTGSAATLTTARAIAVAGDVTGTANFDGSAGISITTTLATDAIVTANITDANVTVAKMAANSVDSNQYVDGSIDTAHIADSQITVAKMAANSVDSDQYVDGSIDTAHIADDQVTGDKLSNDVTIANDLTVSGNLVVTGSTTQTGALLSNSNFQALSQNNSGNSTDFGFYGKYVESSTTKYAGLAFDASTDNTFRLFVDTTAAPGSTVNTGATGYAAGTLIAGEVSMTTLDIGGTNVTSTAAELNILDGVTSTAAELNVLDGITAVVGELNALDIGSTAVGTAVASKAVILDSNKDYTGVRNFTISGELDAATLDVSGNVDVDGVLETDNLTIGGAQGTDGQVLTSTGSGVGWEDAAAGFDPDAAVVFNESSADVDFRVESNGDTHMLFVDGGNDAVSIGTSDASPRGILNVSGGASNAVTTLLSLDDMGIRGAGTAQAIDFVMGRPGFISEDACASIRGVCTASSATAASHGISLEFHTGVGTGQHKHMTLSATGAITQFGSDEVPTYGNPYVSTSIVIGPTGASGLVNGGLTNSIALYNKSGELYAVDSSHNNTQITPHNWELISDGPSEELAWTYWSQRPSPDDRDTTQAINVDMAKVIRKVEDLVGEKLIYTENSNMDDHTHQNIIADIQTALTNLTTRIEALEG